MTKRQTCFLRFLAWYVSDQRLVDVDSRTITSAQMHISNLVSGAAASATQKVFTLQLDLSCPRFGLEYRTDNEQSIVVAMMKGKFGLRLDHSLTLPPLRQRVNHCTAHISVGRLQVRLPSALSCEQCPYRDLYASDYHMFQ